MDNQMHKRQQQPRSNSIGGQEFGLGGHQRLKQSIYTQQNPYVDGTHYYNQRNRYNSNYFQQNVPSDRSLSPMSLKSQASEFYVPQRGDSTKYSPDRHPKNHLHASLECLNVSYSDYGRNQKQQQPQQALPHHLRYQQHQQQQQPQQYLNQTLQDHHYAAGYVLTAAPADTVINRNAEQDLAAAAMGNPTQLFNSINLTPSSSGPMISVGAQHNYQNHNLFSRGNLPISQSPLHRRIGGNPVHGQGQSPSVLNHLSNSGSSPIRAGHSSLSLASSTYLIEDKLQNEIKKLQSELNSEREKNSALNSQLNINSNLMAAFEQSLTTLNTRLRQLSAMSEKKDQEIDELRERLSKLNSSPRNVREDNFKPIGENNHQDDSEHSQKESDGSSNINPAENDKNGEQNYLQIIEDLKRQLIEKDRLLTDTRLEALSAAHQLEQLESRLNGENSMLVNEDDLDEGVIVVNHSPSDSDVVTDSAHFSEANSQISKTNDHQQQYYGQNRKNINSDDMMLFTPTRNSQGNTNNTGNSNISNNSTDDTSELHRNYSQQYQLHQQDNQSSHSSSDYHVEDKSVGDTSNQQDSDVRKVEQYTNSGNDHDAMNRLLDTMLVSN